MGESRIFRTGWWFENFVFSTAAVIVWVSAEFVPREHQNPFAFVYLFVVLIGLVIRRPECTVNFYRGEIVWSESSGLRVRRHSALVSEVTVVWCQPGNWINRSSVWLFRNNRDWIPVGSFPSYEAATKAANTLARLGSWSVQEPSEGISRTNQHYKITYMADASVQTSQTK